MCNRDTVHEKLDDDSRGGRTGYDPAGGRKNDGILSGRFQNKINIISLKQKMKKTQKIKRSKNTVGLENREEHQG